MTDFQYIALTFTGGWLALVGIKFRRSTAVLIGGLVAISAYAAAAIALGKASPDVIGLGLPQSWLRTIAFAVVWLALMLAYSPVADRLATRWFKKPPTLQSFRTIQESVAKLIAGILVAWALGGILEELVFRGIVLKSLAVALTGLRGAPAATVIAVCAAAAGAGLIHYYQGPRAMVTIMQLSILFGVLFVISGYNLWTVILCHGMYDTIAFIRFATGKSRYSNLDGDSAATLAGS
jgi:membrane protease YdiL (CAAX protease family)